MGEGWIKLHRCLMDKAIFDNEKLLKVFIWCLLKASRKEREQVIGLQKIALEPGQFIYGRKKAAKELNLSGSTIQRYMTHLKNNQTIDIKPNNKFSLVTVVNWELYQMKEEEVNSKMDNKWTTDGQQMDTNKNVKNVKNVKNKTIGDYTQNPKLITAINDFMEMRTKIKKPMTERAVELMLGKLSTMADTDEVKIALLEQSTEHNWLSIYPLKQDKQPQQKGGHINAGNKRRNSNPDNRDWEAILGVD